MVGMPRPTGAPVLDPTCERLAVQLRRPTHSYGFRPGRGPHDALDALSVAITSRKVNYILDADVRDFFGSVSQDWLVSFLEHRIGDSASSA